MMRNAKSKDICSYANLQQKQTGSDKPEKDLTPTTRWLATVSQFGLSYSMISL